MPTPQESNQLPYFGPNPRWYDQLVSFSLSWLPEARRKQQELDLKTGPVPEATFIPAGVLDLAHEFPTVEDIFLFLKAAVPEEVCEAFRDRQLTWLLEYAAEDDEDLSPLIAAAITCSVGGAIKDGAWLGRRVGNIFYQYLEALETIYQHHCGKEVDREDLEEAKLQRDEIEYFCSQLFGNDLRIIRSILANHAPEAFIYRWEKLEDGKIVLNA
ncbi:hypothetical protein H3C70_04230 [Patescibacteria group bacterium]|nr:hypothetical protein [Patescibacteria group bacterium]